MALHASSLWLTRRVVPLCAALLASCQQGDELPPVQIEGEILSYAANEEVCDGTVEYGERWMTAVATRLGISPDAILPTTYYWLDGEDATQRCDAPGCARIVDDEIRIFASTMLSKHELVHAVHLSAWPRRRPLLTEGLATLFEDDDLHPFIGLDEFEESGIDIDIDIDIDEQLERDHADPETYVAGVWIVHWIVQRHGIDAFRDFWYADIRHGSAEEFRALFEQHFGESLDAMLAEVEGLPACPPVTCVGDIVEWQGDLWTTQSPTSCDDALTRGTRDPDSQLIRTVLMEVPESGTYTVTASTSDRNQGLQIEPCAGPCQNAATHGNFFAGWTDDVEWEAGLYRVTMSKLDATDPGIRVEVRPK